MQAARAKKGRVISATVSRRSKEAAELWLTRLGFGESRPHRWDVRRDHPGCELDVIDPWCGQFVIAAKGESNQ